MTGIHRNIVIEANDIPSDNAVPDGIISKIREKVPNIVNFVKPSAENYTYIDGNELAIVNWSNYIQIREGYFQIKFKQGVVYPTSYSIKGFNGYRSFAKEWYIYGMNEKNGAKELLAENKSEGSTFCTNKSYDCHNGDWATFSIKPTQKAFKYFRMVTKVGSRSDYVSLLLGGFEIFGIYLNTGKIQRCITNARYFKCIFYYIFLYAILC